MEEISDEGGDDIHGDLVVRNTRRGSLIYEDNSSTVQYARGL